MSIVQPGRFAIVKTVDGPDDEQFTVLFADRDSVRNLWNSTKDCDERTLVENLGRAGFTNEKIAALIQLAREQYQTAVGR